MSLTFYIGKRTGSLTENNFNHVMIGGGAITYGLEFIVRYLKDFGGVNWDKYKLQTEGKLLPYFYGEKDPIKEFIDNGQIFGIERLTIEDFNRVTAAMLKGIEEFDNAKDDESFVKLIANYYEYPVDPNRKSFWKMWLDEAETKFKLDERYDPNWKYNPNLKNDEEVIIVPNNEF